ncbi:unnamed protein product, partial [Ectocarpus sp. 8 AP-2014]
STENELAAQIFGDISTPAPWVALSYVMSAATRSGDMFMERSACPKCRPETRGLGAAAI